MEKEVKELYLAAKDVIKNSYSPYSNFKVACAILMNDGNVIKGVNVENASYGLANCAERTAMFTAYTNGYKASDFKKLLILSEKDYFIYPCGACRQVMVELINQNTEVIISTTDGKFQHLTINDLMPYSFSNEDL